MGLKFGKLQQK